MSFKEKFTFEQRVTECERVRSRFPDRIPVIVERGRNSNVPLIDKNKYIVPSSLSLGQFCYVLRNRLKLSSDQAIFLFIDNTLCTTSSLMSEIYARHKDYDGFLYVIYCGESTFG